VLLEIHGHRLALEPDLRPGEATFALVPGQVPVDLRRVLDDPAWARERFRALPAVWVFLTNAHNLPGRFLGRFDRRSVSDTRIFRIGLYADRSASACGGLRDSYQRLCEHFALLARNPPALDEDGFVVDRPEFMRGLASTFYVFPAAERLSATGEPVFFRCHDGLKFCRNGVDHLHDGYFVRSGIRLLYQFSAHPLPPKAEWRDIDARFRAVLDDIILADGSAPRP
jgi:hypothetical protein